MSANINMIGSTYNNNIKDHIKIKWLTTPNTLFTGHREIRLHVPWKLLPCWLSFIVTEDARLALVRKIHQWSYPVLDTVYFNPDQSGKCGHWYNNAMNVKEVTNHFLLEFER